ncbi:MAG: Tfx family DNA-binding protein [Methanothrix sp.]|uniref:Sigma-70 region 4 domain protein n=1 Tax=Methanothrix thermoacetophila (strain DSM 6194 / JCM 14653 / NBRC 101360 / PT) TaxID=349307 RepID=A0B8F8_METTP|nr:MULTISPECIES: Tfx family DNA-binding protein [Methanothrix]ABK14982.1 sigma-70 region 4 domain protein [Methanothrix thermoacetophila PT]MBC7080421.1 Tfx family DNA-binding protein [Methanothrix sp.]NPU86891.1 Tfx family DNA-binding protein [Methanothrix sp.]HOK58067.1 Tfx family DNA-binding protein [Methanothrix sp.]HOL43470.1 Tfx family DNA-binding protein [Methanothrix sp.]
MNSRGFLTERQIQVLRLRRSGMSQEEVAALLGTTRANVSILEKRAMQNIDRALETLKQWKMIHAPVAVSIPEGTDLFALPGIIFREADTRGLKLPVNSIDILAGLKEIAPHLTRRRLIERSFDIYVTEDGEIYVEETGGSRASRSM